MTTTLETTATAHVPILRLGKPYESLDTVVLSNHGDSSPLVEVGQANSDGIGVSTRRAAEGRGESSLDAGCSSDALRAA